MDCAARHVERAVVKKNHSTVDDTFSICFLFFKVSLDCAVTHVEGGTVVHVNAMNLNIFFKSFCSAICGVYFDFAARHVEYGIGALNVHSEGVVCCRCNRAALQIDRAA